MQFSIKKRSLGSIKPAPRFSRGARQTAFFPPPAYSLLNYFPAIFTRVRAIRHFLSDCARCENRTSEIKSTANAAICWNNFFLSFQVIIRDNRNSSRECNDVGICQTFDEYLRVVVWHWLQEWRPKLPFPWNTQMFVHVRALLRPWGAEENDRAHMLWVKHVCSYIIQWARVFGCSSYVCM